MTIAVAACGRQVSPTSASTSSALSWIASSIVSVIVEPGLVVARLAQLDRLAERVLDQPPLAVAAAQLGVERVLEPGQAGALGADAAEQLGGEEVARVGAAVLGDELEPLDLHALDAARADRGHAVGEVGEAGVAAGELLAAACPRASAGDARAWRRPWPGP